MADLVLRERHIYSASSIQTQDLDAVADDLHRTTTQES
jgi:hypothetical protein